MCAAVAAARAGTKAVLIERDGMLGGQASAIYTFGLDAVFDEVGRLIIPGLPWEIIRRTYELGNSDPWWSSLDYKVLQEQGYEAALTPLGGGVAWKSHSYLDRQDFRQVLREMLLEEDIKVLLETPVTGVVLNGSVVGGVVVQGPLKPYTVTAKTVVDTTPQAVVAAAAGKPFGFPEVYLGSHPHVSGVDILPLIDFAVSHTDEVDVLGIADPHREDLIDRFRRGVSISFTGFAGIYGEVCKEASEFRELGRTGSHPFLFFYNGEGRGTYWIHSKKGRTSRLDDPLDLSETILMLRRHQWLTHRFFRRHVPGFENASLEDVHPHIARSLRISREAGDFTDYDVPWEDIERGGSDRTDTILRIMGHPEKGQAQGGWMLPYASLLPKGLEGLLVTGKPACRFIHYHGTCAAVGQAAGVAAALAAEQGVHPRMLDVDPVRSELRRQGAKVD